MNARMARPSVLPMPFARIRLDLTAADALKDIHKTNKDFVQVKMKEENASSPLHL